MKGVSVNEAPFLFMLPDLLYDKLAGIKCLLLFLIL
jgi:hypothetical protein